MLIIKELMEKARQAGASDLHITVGLSPKMRINGCLKSIDVPPLTEEVIEKLLGEILTCQQKKELEKMGEIDFSFSISDSGRYRANIFKQTGSLAAVFRLFRKQIPDMLDLGLPQEAIDIYKKNRGLILITGPAGCGKTTTMAALLDKINTNRNAHIITLEDPIEYLHTHKKSIITQREIGKDSKSYVRAMRAALKQDPDVIALGEMEDLETIRLALNAAETGHLVISSLSTLGTVNTLERLISIFPPYQQQKIRIQLANVLEAVISKQLIITSNQQERIPIYEIMFADRTIKTLIKEDKIVQIPNAMIQKQTEGMQRMDEAIYELYRSGRINRAEALDYAQNVQELEKKLL